MNEIAKLAHELHLMRKDIIDLFYKTFMVVHGMYTEEHLCHILDTHELVCKQEDKSNPLNQSFYIRKREPEWIDIEERLPEGGEENSYFITDGKEIGIGWYETEYVAEDRSEQIQYSSAMWHDESSRILGKVIHWRELPEIPLSLGQLADFGD